jgi:hypothetical protein
VGFERSVIRGLLSFSVAAAIALPGLSWAQATDSTSPPPKAKKQEKDATAVGEVVVTGSHLVHTQHNVAAPVQIIRTEDAKLEGVFDAVGTL